MMYKQTMDYLTYSKKVATALASHEDPVVRALAEFDMAKDTLNVSAPVNKLQFAVWDHHKHSMIHAKKELEQSLPGGAQEKKAMAQGIYDLMNQARDQALGTGRG